MIMNTAHLMHVLVLLFLLCMKTSSSSNDDNLMRCIKAERKALQVFKQGLGIADMQNVLPSWKKEEEDCCKWEGVGCDNRTGHVTHLHLSSLLYPPSKYFSTGDRTYASISPSLHDLSYLMYLDLSSNFLTEIPEFIGSLTKLVHLDLSDTIAGPWNGKSFLYLGNLSNLQYLDLSSSAAILSIGPIPKFFGSLNSLRYLDLSYNSFTGDTPHEFGNLSKLQHLDLANYNDSPADDGVENFGWLYNLSSLTFLDLSYITIDHSSVWLSFIQRLPSLSVLRLNYCDLTAPSSPLGNFSSPISTLVLEGNNINSSIFYWLLHFNGSLVELDLGINALEGRIPESFGHMTALTHLNLGHNLLNGSIPESFGRLKDLTYMDLSANQLSGVLPKSIHSLSNLKVVDFSSNNFTGNLEDLLSGTFPLLKEVWLSENRLTGSLPDITQLSSLRSVQVSSNSLNGYLPTVFEHRSELQFLDLSNNHLRGFLPDFTGFSSLRVLNLSSNKFSGSLPDFTGCPSLQVLRLGENELTEWETQSTGLLSSLVELDLAKNSIRSKISEEHLSNLSSLEYLNTSSNFLTFDFSFKWLPPFKLRELSLASCKLGPKFPNWIRDQKSIENLDISNSQISDTIPIWFSNLSSIRHLNLSSNKIRGKISFKVVYQNIDLSSNNFEGPLPLIPENCVRINLSQNKFSGTLLSLSDFEGFYICFLDFSHNQLFGALPDDWTHFKDLSFLNLGYNHLSGTIPTSIGQLVSLNELILRNNMLHGELPASLTNCSYLEFVDFGLNKLSGKLPPWIGEGLPQLYALILKSNRFSGSIPYEICHLSNLYFLDLSINRISGNIPPCFDNFTAMIQKGTEVDEHIYAFEDPEVLSPDALYDSYTDDVLARWKGQELAYGRNFAYLKMIDLSVNELTGEIPIGIGRLQELRGLNLSRNRFYGHVPQEIGQLKVLEFIDFSTNNFSGEIPQGMSGLNFLAYLYLSNNNFSGRIPSGTQLQTFDISKYEGNTGLCGKPLTNICPGDEPVDHIPPSSTEYEVDEDDSDYTRWLYISAVLGFSTSFWGIIGTLVLNRRWRHAYFLFLYNLKNNFIVSVHIARLRWNV